MVSFSKKIERIISSSRVQGGKLGWRYRHAKTFDEGLGLFGDFLIDHLHELASLKAEVAASSSLRDVTPELQDNLRSELSKFFLETKHTFSDLVTEFAILVETYDVVIPLNNQALDSVKKVLKSRERDISRELKLLRETAENFERKAEHLGLKDDLDFKKSLPLIRGIRGFGLKDLYAMFASGDVPELFSLLEDE